MESQSSSKWSWATARKTCGRRVTDVRQTDRRYYMVNPSHLGLEQVTNRRKCIIRRHQNCIRQWKWHTIGSHAQTICDRVKDDRRKEHYLFSFLSIYSKQSNPWDIKLVRGVARCLGWHKSKWRQQNKQLKTRGDDDTRRQEESVKKNRDLFHSAFFGMAFLSSKLIGFSRSFVRSRLESGRRSTTVESWMSNQKSNDLSVGVLSPPSRRNET